MPKWLHELILFLEANEVLLSSISSFIAIAAAIIGVIGFVFGWWQRLWRSIRNKHSKSGIANGKESTLKTDNRLLDPAIINREVGALTYTTLPAQTQIPEKVHTPISHTSINPSNQNSVSRPSRDVEAYLERLESDVLEGFRVDQYVELTLEASHPTKL